MIPRKSLNIIATLSCSYTNTLKKYSKFFICGEFSNLSNLPLCKRTTEYRSRCLQVVARITTLPARSGISRYPQQFVSKVLCSPSHLEGAFLLLQCIFLFCRCMWCMVFLCFFFQAWVPRIKVCGPFFFFSFSNNAPQNLICGNVGFLIVLECSCKVDHL